MQGQKDKHRSEQVPSVTSSQRCDNAELKQLMLEHAWRFARTVVFARPTDRAR
jgi:hypothetical protein